MSVDPVTATLPVDPGRVHSGVPPCAGAADGHVLSGAGDSGTENGSASVEVELVVYEAAVSESEPHAASIMANSVADAISATEVLQVKFTLDTLKRLSHHRAVTLAAIWSAILVAESAGVLLHVLTSTMMLLRCASARPQPQPGAAASR